MLHIGGLASGCLDAPVARSPLVEARDQLGLLLLRAFGDLELLNREDVHIEVGDGARHPADVRGVFVVLALFIGVGEVEKIPSADAWWTRRGWAARYGLLLARVGGGPRRG